MLPARTVVIRTEAPVARSSLVFVRLDSRGRRIATDLGIELSTSPIVSWLAMIVLAPSIGWRIAGLPLGVVAGALVLAAPVPLARIGRTRRRRRAWRELPRLCSDLSRSLRSGHSLPSALELAVETADMQCPSGLEVTVRQLRAGRPLEDSLLDWSRSVEHEAERLLVAALLLGATVGGDVAVCLDAVGSGVRSEVQVESRRRELTAQARLSAWVLAALPLLFGAVMSAARGERLYSSRSGLVLVAIGLILDAVGLAWMIRITRGVR